MNGRIGGSIGWWAVAGLAVAAGIVAFALPAPASAAGRCGAGAARPWCDTTLTPAARAGLLLQALTRDEKVSLLAGDNVLGLAGDTGVQADAGGETGHSGRSNGVERVGLPPVYYTDGPAGVRQGKATGMPSPLALAAAWDRGLAAEYGAVLGKEARAKGNDVLFGPTINLLRTPLNSRTFESFGEDPVLTGATAVASIKALQEQGVLANLKHFAVYNQEGRVAPTGVGSRFYYNAVIDQRTLRELYLPHFERVIKEAEPGSVMCSYNRVNGVPACENETLLNGILKRDWGYEGYVLADYVAAVKNPVAALNNGLDFEPFPVFFQPPAVLGALAAGQVSEDTIDEHLGRQFRALFAQGFFDRPAFKNDDAQIDKLADEAVARRVAEAGTVLLRNQGGLLPLDAGKLESIALIGPGVTTNPTGGGSASAVPFRNVTPLEAITERVGPGVSVRTDPGTDPASAAAVAQAADVAVVIPVKTTRGSLLDDPCLSLYCGSGPDQDAVIRAVAGANPRTVVVLEHAAPVLTPWREQVGALLAAWYPGQAAGPAIARVLFGDVEPGGRLPATFPLSEDDLPTAGDVERYPGVGEEVKYKEGVLVGYRWYDEKNKGVAYPFGFGLGYTTFAFSRLRLEPSADATEVRISAVVRNTGDRTGAAVPQLYLGLPEPDARTVQPPFQLRGFEKVRLAPGARRRVTFTLDDRDFSYWGPGGWTVARGCYRVGVGASSRDLPRQGVIGRGAECSGALQLPRNAKACTSRRVFRIRLPRGMRAARVTVAGKRVRVVRRGGRLTARVDLRGLSRRRVKVRVAGRTRTGKAIRQTRVYRTCARPGKKRR